MAVKRAGVGQKSDPEEPPTAPPIPPSPMIRAEPEPEPPPPGLLADASNSRRSRRGIGDIPKPAPMNLTVCPMTDDVDLAFAAAERAGTLPRGFLRVRDAQRVLANYQRVMRMILGYATDVGRRPGGKSSL